MQERSESIPGEGSTNRREGGFFSVVCVFEKAGEGRFRETSVKKL